MSDERQPASESHAGRWVLWGVVTMVAAYVLSMGPVTSLEVKHGVTSSFWARTRSFYEPLEWLCSQTGTTDLLHSYERWWDSRLGVDSRVREL